ncbi:amino acid adenylation domain-containing protein [Larkinella arboricola]|uniref:Amino acid adenylation domain-containing protein n=1 Tax=Larkinella arboricola TaxID=643671 RepID=A0A327WSW5_LARAB|nr:non-ribosomal peptide synthetase [Larkinella arboricola]RAJ95573.1 amino acid adenylation domain-containing protein [Larkinella arboricola]
MVDHAVSLPYTPVDFDPFAGPELIHVAPATEPQTEMWSACLLGGDDANRAYNESTSIRFKGPLDRMALEAALQALVRHHEALRSAFSADGRQILVFRDFPIDLFYEDLSGQSTSEREDRVRSYIKQDMLHRFDLVNGPLLKAGLLKVTDDEHHVVLTAHHIICDGWSTGTLLQDLGKLYSANVRQGSADLAEPQAFSQYALEQLTFLNSTEYQQIESYWLHQYKDDIPVLNLPTDFPRPPLRTFKSQRRDYTLDPDLVAGVKKLGVQAGCSFVTTLLATFEAFLGRLTGQESIALGLPAAGQPVAGYNRLVGNCVNLLPIRSYPKADLLFFDFLKQCRETVLDAYDHQQLTFGSLLKKLKIPRDPSRIPLVPVVFNIDMGVTEGVNFHGLTYQLFSNPREFESFEIFLNVTDSNHVLTLEWSYNTQLFRPDTIDRMMADFESVLRTVVANPHVRLDALPLSDANGILEKLNQWNATQTAYPHNTPLHHLIAEAALRYADRTALSFKGQTLTYRALNETVNRLAHYLIAQGIRVGDVVGIAVDRSPEMLMALLAVMKTGAVYVPTDPDYPQERVQFMLTDAAAKRLILSEKYQNRLGTLTPELSIEQALIDSALFPVEEPAVAVSGTDRVYILYTSGSTGKPKGVQIEHHSLVNFLLSMQKVPGIQPGDKLLGVTTISFDISALELYLPLISGAELVLTDAESSKDGRILRDLIRSEGITIMQATPSTWRMMLAVGWHDMPPLKILCGGEALPKDLANQLTEAGNELWNMYGPTETTIWSSLKQIRSGDDLISIGRPIANTTIYILDENRRPQPAGVAGEIYIGGDGVARGYLNRPELTAERFVQNPFKPGEKDILYRTGDLGQFTEDGEIVCLGRIDQQVKIRGYRIELGEIEHTLATLDEVQEAVVMAREDRPGDPRLVAYVVPKIQLSEQNRNAVRSEPISDQEDRRQDVSDWQKPSQDRIRQWKQVLKIVLPDYMVPSEFVLLPTLPLTPNGKIDRKALPKPVSPGNRNPEVPKALSDEEKRLLRIWQMVLGLETISVTDDFFALGGHSLIAIQVMTQLEKETGKRLPLATLFEYPTIQKLAGLLHKDQKVWKSIIPMKPTGRKIPLYVVHGYDLNLLYFKNLIIHLDDDQPVYGLQMLDADGKAEPMKTLEDTAASYISEIIEQNPNGPYAIAGYSSGGYIALEMARQLKAMGKEVKLAGVFDTNADAYWEQQYVSQQPVLQQIARKILRQGPKLIWFTRSLLNKPVDTLAYQKYYIKRKYTEFLVTLGLAQQPKPEGLTDDMLPVIQKNEEVFQRYIMKPYDGVIDLFLAKERPYYVNDFTYLGWRRFAPVVRVHDVPGDHREMLYPPYAREFAHIIQRALDNS